MNVKVTKVPDEYNVSKMIAKSVEEQYISKCPYCGEDKGVWDYTDEKLFLKKGINASFCTSWYGKQDEREHPIRSAFRFWEKNHHWKVRHCKCYTCGLEWETPPYPTDM